MRTALTMRSRSTHRTTRTLHGRVTGRSQMNMMQQATALRPGAPAQRLECLSTARALLALAAAVPAAATRA